MSNNFKIHQTGYVTPYNTWHTLNRNMIMYVHDGAGSIIDREGNYPIAPGCLCFVGSNRFYYTLPDYSIYDRTKMFLSNQELEQALAVFPEYLHMQKRFNPNAMVYAQTDPATTERINKLFDEMQQYEGKEHYHNALLTANYLKLLVILNEYATNSAIPASGMVQEAIEYINSHIHEPMCIDSICKVLHISKYYFCKKFKESTGLTVMNYILKTRIISAKNMLETANMTISEISNRCGFSSQSYFCRVFKEESGMTPLQYQKNLHRK